MNRSWWIGGVVVMNLAVLVATSPPRWSTSDVEDLGTVVLSPESTDLAIDGTVEVGSGLRNDRYYLEVRLTVAGENLGGSGVLHLYVLDAPGDEPGEPVQSEVINAGLGEPLVFEQQLAYGASASDLEALHLLLRLEGEAEIEADVKLTVTADGTESPDKGGSSLSIELD